MAKNGKEQRLIHGLNAAFNRELTTAIRYLVQGSSIHGQQNEPLRQLYRSELQDEIGHAQYLADKIAALGGYPTASPAVDPPPTEVAEMIDNDIEAEQSDIMHYQRLAALADESGDIELKLRMEQQAADESHHAEQLRRLRA